MKQKKKNRIALLLQWAGEQKIWLLLAILLAMASGLCIIVPYIGIYRVMDAVFQHNCTNEFVVQTIMMIAVSVVLRFVLFGCSGVAAHKGAYGALFKVRCMVAEHLAKVPLGTMNERRIGVLIFSKYFMGCSPLNKVLWGGAFEDAPPEPLEQIVNLFC